MPFVSVIVDDKPMLMEVDDRMVPPLVVAEQGEFEGAEGVVARVVTLGEFVEDACVQVYGTLMKAVASIKPDAVEVTFGVTVGGEAGVPFFAKGKGEASLEITIKWALGTEADEPSSKAVKKSDV